MHGHKACFIKVPATALSVLQLASALVLVKVALSAALAVVLFSSDL